MFCHGDPGAAPLVRHGALTEEHRRELAAIDAGQTTIEGVLGELGAGGKRLLVLQALAEAVTRLHRTTTG